MRGVLVLLFLSQAAAAAELLPPVPLDTAGMVLAPPGTGPGPAGSASHCLPEAAAGPVHYGRLVIRNTLFDDVGPYAVTMPGYGTVSAVRDAPRFSYVPPLVTAKPGDTLRFDIVNQLGAADREGGIENFHTHGLIVSPRPCSPVGDFVLVQDAPGSTTSYRMDIPRTLPGKMFGSSRAPRPYPSGLNWFHAHLHGASHDDVMGGQSGLLYIGDTLADFKAAAGPASGAALEKTEIRYLALRDIQVMVPSGRWPDKAMPKTPAGWVSAGWNTGLCPSQANPAQPAAAGEFKGFGYCGAPTAAGTDTVWMFTVNGQYAPTLTLAPGRNQIWRLANLSASTVYALQLVDDVTHEAVPLDVVSLDGMVTGTNPPGSADMKVGVTQAAVLMLPATRAELFVANPAGLERRLTLRTTGITPGNPTTADPWPAMDLAHVVMQGAAAAQTPSASRDTARVLEVTLPFAAFEHKAAAPAAGGTVPPNCVTLPPGGTARRRITFKEVSATDFELGSEVVTAAGVPVDAAATAVGPETFPMQAALGTTVGGVRRVCARLGSQEVWELVNTAQELHNFHIHQVKFRLATQSDPGMQPGAVSFLDPSGVFAPYLAEMQGAASGLDVTAYHDTMPVPPATLDGVTPGRVFVTIPFYAPQQVGTMVFHCHFLDHEDNGMMAPVSVFDPRRQVADAPEDPAFDLTGLISGSVCRLR